MRRREILITSMSATTDWQIAEGSNNKYVIDCLIFGIMVGLVFEDKVKVFGYDQEGRLRSKCWPLPKNYKTEDPSILEDLKLEEAEEILKAYFKETDAEIRILEKAA